MVPRTDLRFCKISNQRIKVASLSTPSSERREAPKAQGGECANIEYIFVTGFAFLFRILLPSRYARHLPPRGRQQNIALYCVGIKTKHDLQ